MFNASLFPVDRLKSPSPVLPDPTSASEAPSPTTPAPATVGDAVIGREALPKTTGQQGSPETEDAAKVTHDPVEASEETDTSDPAEDSMSCNALLKRGFTYITVCCLHSVQPLRLN
jgi:hypothetical protein